MKSRQILLATYFTFLTAIFLWVPWQRRVGDNWRNDGYACVWAGPKEPFTVITRINLSQLGVEFCALTASMAAIFVLTSMFTYRAKGAVRGIPAV